MYPIPYLHTLYALLCILQLRNAVQNSFFFDAYNLGDPEEQTDTGSVSVVTCYTVNNMYNDKPLIIVYNDYCNYNIMCLCAA